MWGFFIFINMNNHLTARAKIKALTSRVEKELYILKYGDAIFEELTDDLYVYIYAICVDKDCFPLIRYHGKVYLDSTRPMLFSTLLRLADDYGIKLDYNNIL